MDRTLPDASAPLDEESGAPVAPSVRGGPARAALAVPAFQRLWVATFASNVGTWMQNVALGAYAYQLSGSATFVSLVGFAQLGPQLLLAPVGGALADAVDRRRLLVATNGVQLLFSLALALVATASHPSRGLLLAVVAGLGVGAALTGPALSSLLPLLVPRPLLPGAVSLQSVQMNLSRVVGPAVGGALLPAIHASGVFAVNAATYVFAVVGVLTVGATPRPAGHGAGVAERLLGGFAVARRDPVVRTVLLTVAAISFFCLPFIGLMPVVAARDLGLDVSGLGYGVLYACFGLGAAGGAVAVGSVLAHRPRQRLVRVGLTVFGVALAVFGLLRSAAPAYPAVVVVGAAYFTVVTALSTRLQEELADAVRGRVMALYMMSFGGVVPLGLLAGGALTPHTGVTAVLLGGAVVALLLAAVVRLPEQRAPRGR